MNENHEQRFADTQPLLGGTRDLKLRRAEAQALRDGLSENEQFMDGKVALMELLDGTRGAATVTLTLREAASAAYDSFMRRIEKSQDEYEIITGTFQGAAAQAAMAQSAAMLAARIDGIEGSREALTTFEISVVS